MNRGKAPQLGLPIRDPDGALRQERRLPPLKTSHGVARDFVKGRLRMWGRDDIVDDALVVVGELFSNAITHAPSPEYVVAVDWNDGMIRLEMWDSSPLRPQTLSVDLDDEHGRGMRIVDALSAAWGSRIAASGKCVWAVLPLKPKYDAEYPPNQGKGQCPSTHLGEPPRRASPGFKA